MHYFTELTTKQKSIITVIVTFVIAGAVFYNIYKDRDLELVAMLEGRYNQGKTLDCKGIDVNSTNFDYSVGTQSFIGHKDSTNPNMIINIRECR